MWSNMQHKQQPPIESQDGMPRFDTFKEQPPSKQAEPELTKERIEQIEQENESLVNLMHEMKRVQEINMGANISDEQRRKNAADMMAKFAQCMGLDGSDDEY